MKIDHRDLIKMLVWIFSFFSVCVCVWMCVGGKNDIFVFARVLFSRRNWLIIIFEFSRIISFVELILSHYLLQRTPHGARYPGGIRRFINNIVIPFIRLQLLAFTSCFFFLFYFITNKHVYYIIARIFCNGINGNDIFVVYCNVSHGSEIGFIA